MRELKSKPIISLVIVWLVIALGVFLRGFRADQYPIDNTDDGLFRDFESRNLDENLGILEEWVLNYSGNYSARIVGWVRGIDVEKLNDSSKIQPQGVSLRKPAFWCYVSDPYLKPINDFLIKGNKTIVNSTSKKSPIFKFIVFIFTSSLLIRLRF